MEPLLLTERAVGEVLSVGRSSVRKLMDSGRLPAIHVGRSLRFHVDDVKRIAEELRQDSWRHDQVVRWRKEGGGASQNWAVRKSMVHAAKEEET